ncbi:MAG: IPT/TIG domain-containing protein [Deltaproteobacteria bacterium]|nr:IPT/TIG domain-containing protein [Deltaproteobacteria bacterium]
MKFFTVSAAVVAVLALLVVSGCKKEMHLDSLKPASGIMSGNETVQIKGSGFKKEQGITVYFGTERCPTAFVEGSRKVVVTTPTYSKSTLVDVRVISDDGEEIILRKAFKFIKSAKWSPMDGYGSKGRSGP